MDPFTLAACGLAAGFTVLFGASHTNDDDDDEVDRRDGGEEDMLTDIDCSDDDGGESDAEGGGEHQTSLSDFE